MIKEKQIKVNIARKNVSQYKEKYNCKVDDIVFIDIEDINKNSRLKITAICEKCNSENNISIYKYYQNKSRGGYYGCRKCSRIKAKKTSYEKYGVDNYMKTDECKDKVAKNNITKYGVKTTLLEPKTKEKIKRTNKEKYGTEEPLSSNIIKEKSKKTLLEKYGVEHYSKTIKFKEVSFNRWKKEILEKLKNYNIKEFILLNNKTINIKCDCGKNHYFNINSKNLYQRYSIQKTILCTVCNKIDSQVSGLELQLLNFIKENYNGKIIESDKNILNGKELDIYLPELNLAFEFNGVYWHNELYKDKNYHLGKTENCLNIGIQLIHIWEDDWMYKQDIVKSMILNKLNKTLNKIYGRKTKVKEITNNKLIRQFLNENHLQGFVGSSIKLGLYYENELVSLMTFGKKRLFMKSKSKNENEYELLRFCNKLNTNVIGGASKLFKYFIKNYPIENITTFADRSHSNGNLYNKLGFNFIHKTQPNYYYVINKERKYRFNYRKDVLVKDGYDKNKSEHEIMLERKIYRIYNAVI